MRAQFVYEKFSEESDPIKDIGIGTLELLKKEYEKLRFQTMEKIFDENFLDVKFNTQEMIPSTISSTYFNIIKYFMMHTSSNKQIIFDREIQRFKRAIMANQVNDQFGIKKIIKRMAKILNDKFGIKVKV